MECNRTMFNVEFKRMRGYNLLTVKKQKLFGGVNAVCGALNLNKNMLKFGVAHEM